MADQTTFEVKFNDGITLECERRNFVEGMENLPTDTRVVLEYGSTTMAGLFKGLKDGQITLQVYSRGGSTMQWPIKGLRSYLVPVQTLKPFS